METVKGKPYFCNVKDRLEQFKYLDKDLSCEILIIGAGIDGAIANYFLSKKHNVVLVDKNKIGFGCTSCATALLEYQLDEFASDLKKELTQEQVVNIYKMGQNSIKKIEDFVKIHGNNCFFKKRPTFLYTNSVFGKNKIIKEFNFRKQNGFKCKLITPNNNPFPFKIKAGILCEDGGCEFNPYSFTKQMIENSSNENKIFENTTIEEIIRDKNKMIAITNYGYKIICDKIIVATGFNWEVVKKDNLCDRFVTYSIVTEPIKDFKYYKSCLVHDNNSPYHYLRTLPDGRLIFGGEDTVYNKNKEINYKLAQKKYVTLEKDLKKLFPEIKEKIKVSNRFCGVFGTTDNNLGIIGKSHINNIFYFISCGSNGIINAMFGVDLLDDIFNNRENKLETIFSPLR